MNEEAILRNDINIARYELGELLKIINYFFRKVDIKYDFYNRVVLEADKACGLILSYDEELARLSEKVRRA